MKKNSNKIRAKLNEFSIISVLFKSNNVQILM